MLFGYFLGKTYDQIGGMCADAPWLEFESDFFGCRKKIADRGGF